MTVVLGEAREVLERTPGALAGLLRGISREWHDADEGPGTWSPRQVVAHLIQADETNWLPRARFILEHGDALPFEAFDRFAHLERYRDWPLDDLLDRFTVVRSASLETLRSWNLTPQRLSLAGRHPELGRVTLGELLATWAAHDLDHVAQVVRVMAGRYAGEVGPWRVNLRVLRG